MTDGDPRARGRAARLKRAVALLAVALASLGALASASAATRRIVVAVGHNTGADDQAALRYAEEDASKFADVMIDLGDVAPEDLFLVQGKGSTAVHAALDQAARAIGRARSRPDDRVVLIFYYSGHSDGQTIELGRERLAYSELRAWLATTGADVRVAIIDSCKSGALVQHKGGTRGPAFDVTMVDELTASGEVFLTSAAADEDALESAEIRGSFFTHHLVSGLRGAADSSGDGAVTLSEAYEYAFNHTVMSTAQTGEGLQHPTYDYRVAGRGELRLTELTRRTAVLEMPADFQRVLVVQPRRDQVIAELGRGAGRRIAVAPGEYSLRLWRAGQPSVGRVLLGPGQTVRVTWEQLTPTETPTAYPHKGGRTEEPTVLEPALPPAQQALWDRLALHVDDDDQLYAGSARLRIDQRDAFERMQRPDLVRTYDHRRTVRRWMIGAGFGAAVLSIGAEIVVASGRCATSSDPSCNGQIALALGSLTLAFIGGTVVGIAGLVRDSDVVDRRGIRALVSEHNRALRAHLLAAPPGALPAGATSERAAHDLHLSAWRTHAGHGGGGLALSGRF